MFKNQIYIIILLLPSVILAQNNTYKYSFGAIPAISYDSDLGYQYGAAINLYQYNKKSDYSKYNHSLYLEWSRFSKGSGINRITYDSDKLLKHVRSTLDITYMTDQMMDFYGFNGYQSEYKSDYEQINRQFYKYDRKLFRIKADFQGKFNDNGFGWIGGYLFYNIKTDTVNINKLNLKPVQGGNLYQRYLENNLISSEEANGGVIHYLKLGLKYDTRNRLANPTNGVWTEAILQTAIAGSGNFSHSKLAIVHRQYFNLLNELNFAYRVYYHATFSKSDIPFYAQPLLVSSYLSASTFQGIGGQTTVRGVMRNRVVGNDIAFANLELRYKLLKFSAFKQQFYIGTNVFFDSGIILKPISVSNQLSIQEKESLLLGNFEKGKLHNSAGIGIKIGWNENFVVSADVGKAFNSQDGSLGIYLGLNYLY